MKKARIWGALLSVLMLIQLTSCGAANDADMSADTMEFSSTEASLYGVAAYDEKVYDAYYDYDSSVSYETGNVQNDLSERKIIKTASVSFETKTYDYFLTVLSSFIQEYGGYVQSEQSYGSDTYSNSTRNTYMIIRVPLETYDTFMNEACKIGTVTYKSEDSSDVTMSYVDTESHIKALETEYDALLTILEKAEKLEDVISLQSRISEVTYQLENYKSQLRKYDDLIAYCTVSIDVHEVERETPNVKEMTFGEKITSGLQETFEEMAEDMSEFAIWFITSLPYFVIWAVIILAIVIIIKILIARYKKHKLQKIANMQLSNMQTGVPKNEEKEQSKTNH